MISRIITKQIINDLKPGHGAVLFGATRNGKTVMMDQIQKMIPYKKISLFHIEDFDHSQNQSIRVERLYR